ncbi:spirocyclase AveC family protein [Pseudonocardia sp. RS010]|uniref:spirocyclase AveC family protein n=1 Tax=Pseudonocardia sp. RS010 TaxID=3385979 RepID=UPI00399F6CFA
MTQTQEPAPGVLPAPAAASATAEETKYGRRGGVGVWATIGLLGIILSVWAYSNWIASDSFTPVPVQGPDEMATWRLVALRCVEAVSVIVLVAFLWSGIVKPLRRDGRISLMGKMILGGVVGFVLDAFLNNNEYLFAWNQNNINTGVWSPWLPLHQSDAPGQYAESFLWGLPMYIYFCAFVALMALNTARFLRRRFPSLSRPQVYLLLFVEAFLFDLVVENIIIRLTEAYGYPRTVGAITLFAGSHFQYPLSEAFLVALVGLAFTWLYMRASESPDGRSPVEYGLDRVSPRWRETVSTLAVVGYCFTVLLVVYHVPFAYIGLHADSVAELPSYLLPAVG